ncbi:hypothetical protein Nitsa_1144 [Nitratifractor salsuginis DSM 16511]|uniref:Uncharacterized protein n=1 Tax=Nitratifractor salsuginis (strain DSM 16511 / JCM 12458 / E9I37-1) TaxID=749222 RepID=E6WY23_NITSE|nr:hypothetical protein Nitsa_1144 [Nitratifractor salsuginis DSM 16511]
MSNRKLLLNRVLIVEDWGLGKERQKIVDRLLGCSVTRLLGYKGVVKQRKPKFLIPHSSFLTPFHKAPAL